MPSMRFKVNWVLNQELAVGTAPQKQKHLKKLADEGIKSILSLCDENELKNDLNLAELFDHKRYVLPDHKTGKILSSIELNESLDILRNLIKSGPVFVHCYAAVERSPLVCMAWLIKEHHLTLQQSLDYLMQANSGTNPLPGQLRVLKEI
tara:strand:+ start:13 stop:462 length:450 start_codon:yes stop_codon:yes gene_type:complete